ARRAPRRARIAADPVRGDLRRPGREAPGHPREIAFPHPVKGSDVNASAPNPWYREPWPWIIMAGPAIVIVAGIATTVLAVTSFDGLVADDYYKQGLGINRVLARDEGAKALGVSAVVQFNETRTRVRVVLGEGARPASLRLALAHPTIAGEDQQVEL